MTDRSFVSRRKTLALVGGGAICAATGGFAYSVTRRPNRALEPWSDAGQYEDPRMRALSWAILAPNPHNRQPWMVDLSKAETVTLYVDTDRLLPHTDPYSRQITIGLGCFLELLRMAALEDGYIVETDLFPDGSDALVLDGRPVAVCRFLQSDAPRDPLFAHVPKRRSLKEPFDINRAVTQAQLDRIVAAARQVPSGGSIAPDDISYFRKLTSDALMVEIETPHTYRESVDLFRIGRREINANPDGIDFSGPLFETISRVGMFSRETALDPDSMAYKGGVDAVLANTQTAMGHIWLVSGPTPAKTRSLLGPTGFG